MPEKLFSGSDNRLSPIIKWPGGKEKELKPIFSALPVAFENYYEPFVGGGAVFTAMSAKHFFINDKSNELICLYDSIASQEKEFFEWLDYINNTWVSALKYCAKLYPLVDFYQKQRSSIQLSSLVKLIDQFISDNRQQLSDIIAYNFTWYRNFFLEIFEETICRKMLRMQKLEQEKGHMPSTDIQDNIATALMGSVYMYFRKLYNEYKNVNFSQNLQTALFVFIRNYSYCGMFRYSRTGEFNVPYGGIGYNRKTLLKKMQYYRSDDLLFHFSKTTIMCADFMDFFDKYTPQPDDFVFLDPPYDSEFSTYAQNLFTQKDQERLANFLCNTCKAKWLLIIKNTPFIMSLYNDKNLFISSFDKKYQVSFMNRNNRDTEHLLISNYQY